MVDICAGCAVAQAHILPLGKLLGLAMKQVISAKYYTLYYIHTIILYALCVYMHHRMYA